MGRQQFPCKAMPATQLLTTSRLQTTQIHTQLLKSNFQYITLTLCMVIFIRTPIIILSGHPSLTFYLETFYLDTH